MILLLTLKVTEEPLPRMDKPNPSAMRTIQLKRPSQLRK